MIAFVLTINRAQQQSAKRCGILLPKNVWTHGQVYVAFSQCRNPTTVFMGRAVTFQRLQGKKEPGKKYIKNVVYKEVLS